MIIKTQVLERVTITGRFSEGDSDVIAQESMVSMGCHIVSFDTFDGGDSFNIVGERPYNEMSADDYLEMAMGEEAYGKMMGLDTEEV